jgi:hypothetical protein
MLRVFENSVLKKIFGPKRDEGTVEWRKLYNEKLYNLYCSRNINRVVITRRIRWGVCSTYGRTGNVHTEFWWGDLRERVHLEDPGVNQRMILKWIFNERDGGGA